MAPSCFSERAGRDVLVRVTCGSLYSPGSSNVGSVRKRNSAISMSAVGPPIRVILGVFMGLHNEAGPHRHGQGLGGHALQRYPINSSARASTVSGIVRPSSLAVFKLIMSSNLVGCSIGISAGFPPLKIILT
jgi:hypothetical protein